MNTYMATLTTNNTDSLTTTTNAAITRALHPYDPLVRTDSDGNREVILTIKTPTALGAMGPLAEAAAALGGEAIRVDIVDRDEPPAAPDLLSTREAADLMQVDESYVRALISRKKLRASRVGNRMLVLRRGDVTAYMGRPDSLLRKK